MLNRIERVKKKVLCTTIGHSGLVTLEMTGKDRGNIKCSRCDNILHLNDIIHKSN